MRAYTFTNYAGRFLYVEAHNKANTTTGGPTQALSFAGPDGVYQPAVNMGKFVDGGAYMYHRQLVSLRGAYANIAAKDVTVRVAAATGATDTVKPTEWTALVAAAAHRDLPEGLHHEVHGSDRGL